MWLMLQVDKPEDFVISTGVAHSVREFVLASFKHVGIDIVYVLITTQSIFYAVSDAANQ